jgi:hypothetical protein
MKKILLALALLMLPTLALAQSSQRNPCYSVNGVGCNPVGTNTPLPVTGSSNVSTYSASAAFSNTTVGSGDLYCIYGSATKTVKVKGARITGVASGASTTASLSLVRRSTADTGGTPTVLTNVSSDSNNPAGTATVTQYGGANLPTAGTTVGNVRSRYISLPLPTVVGVSEGLFQFTPYWDQPQVLRGVNQGLCVNASANSTSWAIDMEWSEE